MNRLRWTLALLCMSLSLTVHAESRYHVKTIGLPQGLSNSSVLSLYSDQRGLLWIGTYDGLNVYDGNHITSFRTNTSHGMPLLSNIIYDINRADGDCIWITTNMGVNKFSTLKQRVVGAYRQFSGDMNVFSYDYGQGNTWVIDGHSVYYYNPKEDKFYKTSLNISGINADMSFVDRGNSLWLFYNDGHVKKCSLADFNAKDAKPRCVDAKFHAAPIKYIFYVQGMVAFIDNGGDLYLYSPETHMKVFIRNVSDLIRQNGLVRSILFAGDDVYVCFLQGEIFRLKGGTHYDVELVADDARVFSCLSDSKQEILWVGTDGQGVKLYFKPSLLFEQLLFEQVGNRINRPVRSFLVDGNNNLWIATKGDGVVRIPRARSLVKGNPAYQFEQATVYFPNKKFDLNNFRRAQLEFQALSLEREKAGKGFWIGGGMGNPLSYYDPSSDEVVPLTNTNGISYVFDIFENPAHVLWLCTGDGLVKVVADAANRRVISKKRIIFKNPRLPRNINIISMFMEGDSVIWLASRSSGLLRYDVKRGKCLIYKLSTGNSVASNDILSMCKIGNVFWLGTNSGFVKMTLRARRAPLLQYVGKSYGLLSDMIHGVLSDKEGNLWLSTDKGLVKYNPKEELFHSYYLNTVVHVGEFCDGAYYKDPVSQTLYFGGINGLLYFNDSNRPTVTLNPHVYFYDLGVNGKSVFFGDYYDTSKKRLELTSTNCRLQLKFSVIDYVNGEDYEYSYRLKGDNNEWTPFTARNVVNLGPLYPGDYVLQIRGKVDAHRTNDCYHELKIHVSAPWYLSTWAIIAYLFLVGVLYTYGYRFWRKSHHQTSILNEHMIREQYNREDAMQERHWRFIMGNTATLLRQSLELARSHPDKQRDELLGDVCDSLLSLVPYDNIGTGGKDIVELLLPKSPKSYAPYGLKNLLTDCLLSLAESDEKARIGNVNIEVGDELMVTLPYHPLLYVLRYLLYEGAHASVPVTITAVVENGRLNLQVKGSSAFVKSFALKRVERKAQTFLPAVLYLYGVDLLRADVNLTDQTLELSVKMPSHRVAKNTDQEDKGTLLLLEDNAEMDRYITDRLQEEYQIIHTTNIKQAFALLSSEQPQVFIADLQMCFKEEWRFLDYAKSLSPGLLEHVVFLPILTWQGYLRIRSYMQNSADGFILMPYGLVALTDILQFALTYHPVRLNMFNSRQDMDYQVLMENLSDKGRKFLLQVNKIIEENINNDDLSVKFLADKLNMSTRMFYRRFKEISSLPPNAFIKNCRIEYAAKLLETTSMTVNDIVYACGIQSKSYFYRAFFSHYGCTPMEYKWQHDAGDLSEQEKE